MKTDTSPSQASQDADPFLRGLPEKDSIPITLDETLLPMPDELPPPCDEDDWECLEKRASAPEAPKKEQPPEQAAEQPAEQVTEQVTGQAASSAPAPQMYSRSRRLRDNAFWSRIPIPHTINLIGHWAHDLKLGRFSGRSVLGILSLVGVLTLLLLLIAVLMRSESLKGILS